MADDARYPFKKLERRLEGRWSLDDVAKFAYPKSLELAPKAEKEREIDADARLMYPNSPELWWR